MSTANYLPEVLETTEAERLATGFAFTEGPPWHPDGYWFFVDLRQNKLLKLTHGKPPELVRNTIGGNGTTFGGRRGCVPESAKHSSRVPRVPPSSYRCASAPGP
jgi:hypothetical protein